MTRLGVTGVQKDATRPAFRLRSGCSALAWPVSPSIAGPAKAGKSGWGGLAEGLMNSVLWGWGGAAG